MEEVVRATRERLSRDLWFASTDSVNGDFWLYEESAGKEPPYGVVLQQREPGGDLIGTTGLRQCIVIVRFETPVEWKNWDSWHYQHHVHASTQLRGFSPILTTGVPIAPMQQHAYANTAMVDPEDNTRYSASAFRITLRPVT